MDLELPHAAQRMLLHLARASIQEAILKDGSLRPILAEMDITPPLRSTLGLFVTLKESIGDGPAGGRRLRGCIGIMKSAKPLYRTVIDTAPKAALEDPRFQPLGKEELPGVHISLSILSPLRPLEDPRKFVLGRDGLQLESGSHRAVFLPQVATEQGWSRQQFLERLAIKAGLSKDGWRKAELSIFEALVIDE